MLADAFRFVALLFRSTQSLRAENLFLRRQLALFMERGVRPRRLDAASRVSLAILARMFGWRGALVVVKPATKYVSGSVLVTQPVKKSKLAYRAYGEKQTSDSGRAKTVLTKKAN